MDRSNEPPEPSSAPGAFAPPSPPAPPDELGAQARAALDEGADRLARRVARARIASALFARDRRITIGRYQLLERVGAGGMGVVWGAWDPELERRVAIKLVKPTRAAARDRILREGQALAKLSHPNIIPIYDVGVVDDQVYLVMEWVRGMTLRAFNESARSRRELLDAYRQAGEGLAAAHKAGVIHRDFKPDNAIFGEDGRVRVLDLGLATDGPGAVDDIAGTPRYMAPEQARGAAITAAVDQFAFCVSLREALLTASTPMLAGWIASIVERGTAPEADRRFASMEALLAALARDPARVWRRRGAVAAILAAAAIAFIAGRGRAAAPAISPCGGSVAEIARSWNPQTRARMVEHLRGLGPVGASEADRLARELDSYGAEWAVERQRACMSHERGELPPSLYERRLVCLARAEASLETVGQLMASVEVDRLDNALIAARSLPSTGGCAAGDVSSVQPPPASVAAPVAAAARTVERARVLTVAASPDALDVAKAAWVAAEATAYAPLRARALLVLGRASEAARVPVALSTSSDRAEAYELGLRAHHLALQAGDDVLAVEAYAWARWNWSRTPDFRPEPWQTIDDIAIRNGPAGRFGRALLYNNLATERIITNDRAGARELLAQALAVWSPPIGDRGQDIELISIYTNLSLVEDEPSKREQRIGEAAGQLEHLLGRDHPSTTNARLHQAVLTQNPEAAKRRFSEVCGQVPAWQQHVRASCAYEQAWLALDQGDLEDAAAAMRVVVDSAEPASSSTRVAHAYLAIASQDPARIRVALAELQQLAPALARQGGFWNEADASDAYVVVAFGLEQLGRRVESTGAWATALPLLADRPAFERRRARVQATLAERWFRTRPAEARALAQAALAWYLAAGGYPGDVQRLRTLVAADARGTRDFR